MEAFDNQLHEHLKDSEYEGECEECQTPIDTDYGYCSRTCYKESLTWIKLKNAEFFRLVQGTKVYPYYYKWRVFKHTQ